MNEEMNGNNMKALSLFVPRPVKSSRSIRAGRRHCHYQTHMKEAGSLSKNSSYISQKVLYVRQRTD